METSYYACCCLSYIEGVDFDAQRLVDWVVSCRDPNGAYGLYPGGVPRLAATYWAAGILRLLRHSAPDPDRDIAWILARQANDGSFVDPNSRHSPIQQTWYAMKSLDLFGALEDVNRVTVGCFAGAILDHKTLNIWDAVCAIDVLQTIGSLDDTSRRKVFHRFVNPALADIPRLPIHQHIPWLVVHDNCL
jgi:prenyltransferase beta subunit